MSQAPPRRVPIEPGFFTIPETAGEPPRLLGTRCKDCGEHFFPRRLVCARCLSEAVEDVSLGPRGTLYTYTIVHAPLFDSRTRETGGYGVGQVDLPEGPRVQAVLSGRAEELRIGREMELELETLRRNDAGQDVVIFRFKPVAEAAA